MKLSDIKPLNESVTFNAVDEEEYEPGKKAFSPRWKKVIEDCWVCKGTGKEHYFNDLGEKKYYKCEYCHGTGKTEEHKDDGPELQVSNGNASLIIDMLGIGTDEDYSGVIMNSEIPAVMKRLIALKNSKDGVSPYTRPDAEYRGQARAVTDETGQSRISRGPTIHSMGANAAQVMRYVDSLMAILKYAQENDMHVAWA